MWTTCHERRALRFTRMERRSSSVASGRIHPNTTQSGYSDGRCKSSRCSSTASAASSRPASSSSICSSRSGLRLARRTAGGQGLGSRCELHPGRLRGHPRLALCGLDASDVGGLSNPSVLPRAFSAGSARSRLTRGLRKLSCERSLTSRATGGLLKVTGTTERANDAGTVDCA